MKRGATREDIIRTTQELIARNGIRAVRVDEIAQALGISKRTLYEMFTDKTDLVSVCLDDMSRRQRQLIAAYCRPRTEPALCQAGKFIQTYIDGLYAVGSQFLSDVRNKLDFSEHFKEHREFCREELAQILEGSREAGLLLDNIDTKGLSDRILSTLLELRLSLVPREELYLFCRTMLRGTATRDGIELIDQSA